MMFRKLTNMSYLIPSLTRTVGRTLKEISHEKIHSTDRFRVSADSEFIGYLKQLIYVVAFTGKEHTSLNPEEFYSKEVKFLNILRTRIGRGISSRR